jgi:hypothetical protein
MTEMDIETSVHYVHLTRLIAREDFINVVLLEDTNVSEDRAASILRVK